MHDLVSIIMPAYNSEKYIAESINSVLNQEYNNWELIIINDKSTDQTSNIVNNFAILDPRIRVFNLEINKGVSNARNVGLLNAKGKYIAFLDSDDTWCKYKLDYQITQMNEKNHKFSYTSYEIMNQNSLSYNRILVPKQINFSKLKFYNPIGCLTVIISRDLLGSLLFSQIKHEDYAFWLSILRNSNDYAYGYPRVTANYRKYQGSLSSKKTKTIVWTWNIHRKHLNSNIFLSLLCTASQTIYAIKKHLLRKNI